MKKLIEALQVIQDECAKHESCRKCPMRRDNSVWGNCIFDTVNPCDIDLDKIEMNLLEKEQL